VINLQEKYSDFNIGWRSEWDSNPQYGRTSICDGARRDDLFLTAQQRPANILGATGRAQPILRPMPQ
jgi:hypothetical protein